MLVGHCFVRLHHFSVRSLANPLCDKGSIEEKAMVALLLEHFRSGAIASERGELLVLEEHVGLLRSVASPLHREMLGRGHCCH